MSYSSIETELLYGTPRGTLSKLSVDGTRRYVQLCYDYEHLVEGVLPSCWTIEIERVQPIFGIPTVHIWLKNCVSQREMSLIIDPLLSEGSTTFFYARNEDRTTALRLILEESRDEKRIFQGQLSFLEDKVTHLVYAPRPHNPVDSSRS